VADLDVHVAAVIDHNEQLLQLNKAQLKSSQTSEGGPLINSMTGSDQYSPRWAKKKGYVYPDLFLTGSFYKEMDIFVQEPDQYFITSFDDKTGVLTDMYGEDIFGIRDKNKAQRIFTIAFSLRFKRFVLS